MDIVIDIEDPTPLFAQLIAQIRTAVIKGWIEPGAPLPSIRQLANDLELNNKTVAKAYRLLERDSVIQTRGYRGTFVHPNAKDNSQIDLSVPIKEQLSDTVSRLRELGATDSEIRIAFGELMKPRH